MSKAPTLAKSESEARDRARQTTQVDELNAMQNGSQAGTAENQTLTGDQSVVSDSPSLRIPFISKLSKKTKARLKLLISAGLFASLFVFGKVDLSEAMSAALAANKIYIAAACVLFLSSVFVMAHRWQLLAAAVGLARPFFLMVQLCYVGLFFNLFLPSTVGGDVSRCYYLTKGTNKYLHALTSVLVDRAMGLAVLLLFATVGILFGPGGEGLPWHLKVPVFVLTIGMYCVIPFLPPLSKRILGENNWVTRKLHNSSANVYWQDKGLIAMTLFLSLVSQIIMVACHVAVGLALGLNDIPLWYYFVFYPSVAVLGFVTPSVNGIGVREWAYTYFLMLMGVDKSVAFTYAVIWLGLTTMGSLAGGIVYIAGKFRISKDEVSSLQK